jgi:hypothetical protein
MINVNQWLKAGSAVLNKNAPAILTAFGAVGVVGTAVLTGKATFEAARQIEELKEDRKRMVMTDPTVSIEVTRTDAIKLVWPLYIAAVSSGVLSCGAIVMSHRISSRRAAMLAAAYALNESKLEEYQDKIKEKFGVKKEKEARDSLAQDRVNQLEDAGFAFSNPMTGKVWIIEAYTGRPFLSTVEDVKRAVNEINHHINNKRWAKLAQFHDMVGLERVSTSDYFGWTEDDPMDIDWSTTTSNDGALAVHVFEYVPHPVQDPERMANSSFR